MKFSERNSGRGGFSAMNRASVISREKEEMWFVDSDLMSINTGDKMEGDECVVFGTLKDAIGVAGALLAKLVRTYPDDPNLAAIHDDYDPVYDVSVWGVEIYRGSKDGDPEYEIYPAGSLVRDPRGQDISLGYWSDYVKKMGQ